MKRVNELVNHELSRLIRQYLPVENYGLISVTDVAVAKNLKTAHIYISGIGVGPQQREKVLESLARVRVQLQHDLSRRVILKYTPQLMFQWDDGIERGQHVVDLLESLDEKQK